MEKKSMIVRLVLSALVLWRVWLGDRWALLIVLSFLTLNAEVATYAAQRRKRGSDDVVKRTW